MNFKASSGQGSLPPNASRDEIGLEFLRGAGVEIGAGSRPTKTHPAASVKYVDKRSDEEVEHVPVVGHQTAPRRNACGEL